MRIVIISKANKEKVLELIDPKYLDAYKKLYPEGKYTYTEIEAVTIPEPGQRDETLRSKWISRTDYGIRK